MRPTTGPRTVEAAALRRRWLPADKVNIIFIIIIVVIIVVVIVIVIAMLVEDHSKAPFGKRRG